MTTNPSLAEICDAVPEQDEPDLCRCGKHYEGAPCPPIDHDLLTRIPIETACCGGHGEKIATDLLTYRAAVGGYDATQDTLWDLVDTARSLVWRVEHGPHQDHDSTSSLLDDAHRILGEVLGRLSQVTP